MISSCSSLPLSSGRLSGAIREFDSPEPSVRELAEVSLRRMGEEALPALREIIKAGPEDRTYRAVRILGRMGPDAGDAVPDLVGLLTGPDLSIPSALAHALAGIGTPAETAVLPLLASTDEMVRYWAVVALGRMNDPGPDALAGLIRAIEDPESTVSAVAEMLLVTQGKRALPALRTAAELDDPDSGAKLAGIMARIDHAEPGDADLSGK